MPHGHCYFWSPEIMWTHAISDTIIAMAYFTIPLSLIFIFRKRKDFKFIWILALFALFIWGCGATHVFDVINIWVPYYRMDGLVRVITALASIGTALVLIKITPQVLLIPSAAEWKRVNEELESQIKQLQAKDNTIARIREFEFLADSVPQIIWTADTTGKATYFNKLWFDYSGWQPEDVMVRSRDEVIHPDDLESYKQTWENCINEVCPFIGEFRLRRKDGMYRWHMLKAVPMKDDEGHVIKWFGSASDIHDRKTFEIDLANKNKELEVINSDLDNFVYTASHDLKAPVSNLEGLINAAFEEVKETCPENVTLLFDMMNTSVQKFKDTINDLTDLSRIQKNMEQDISSVSVKEMVEEFRLQNEESIKATGAEIVEIFEKDTIHFSRKNFRSLVHNLLSNAIKYHNPERKPVIELRTSVVNGQFVLTVKDNGLGFDMSKKDQVFKMFKRLHDYVEGTGLGLYIVKRIVSNAGGRVDAESTLGVGSVFTVFIPLNQ